MFGFLKRWWALRAADLQNPRPVVIHGGKALRLHRRNSDAFCQQGGIGSGKMLRARDFLSATRSPERAAMEDRCREWARPFRNHLSFDARLDRSESPGLGPRIMSPGANLVAGQSASDLRDRELDHDLHSGPGEDCSVPAKRSGYFVQICLP